MAERAVELAVLNAVRPAKKLLLEPLESVEAELLKAPHFAAYAQVYLSGAFLARSHPVDITYLARTYKFRIVEDLADEMESMTMENRDETVFRVDSNCHISFASSSGIVEDVILSTVPFQEVGGCEEAKQIFDRFFFDPLRR